MSPAWECEVLATGHREVPKSDFFFNVFLISFYSEASKVFIRRKKSTVLVDRHMGGLRETCPQSDL